MPDLEQQIVERLNKACDSVLSDPGWTGHVRLGIEKARNAMLAELRDFPLPSPPEPSTQRQGDFPRERVGELIIAAHHASVKLYHACTAKEITRSDKRDYMAVAEKIEKAKNSCFDFDDSLTQARQPQPPLATDAEAELRKMRSHMKPSDTFDPVEWAALEKLREMPASPITGRPLPPHKDDRITQQEILPDCGCVKCSDARPSSRHMVVCEFCGNKRCPHATYHGYACTESNEPGQAGSMFGPSPQPPPTENRK